MSCQLATRAPRWGVQSHAAAGAGGWGTRDPEPRHKWMGPEVWAARIGAEEEAARLQRAGRESPALSGTAAGAPGLLTHKVQQNWWCGARNAGGGWTPRSAPAPPSIEWCRRLWQLFLDKTGGRGKKDGLELNVGLAFPSTGHRGQQRREPNTSPLRRTHPGHRCPRAAGTRGGLCSTVTGAGPPERSLSPRPGCAPCLPECRLAPLSFFTEFSVLFLHCHMVTCVLLRAKDEHRRTASKGTVS